MSDNSKSSSGGFGALGLTGFIGSVVAWCNTASFVGWAGAGKSLLVGAGTSMGASIVGIPAAIGGALVGGFLGLLTRSKKVAVVGAIAGAVLCGVGGGIYGAVEGYDFAKDALTQPCKTAFNTSAEKAPGAKAVAYVIETPNAAPQARLTM